MEDLNPGGRETILFLHGWPLSHRAFEYQLNQLPKMGMRCVAMDLRGFGLSDKPFSGYGYDRMAEDVRQVISRLGLKNITLAGHSMGGAIAVRYMGQTGGAGVSRLVLLGAAAPSFVRAPGFPYGFSKDLVTTWVKQCYDDRPQLLRDFGDMFFFQYKTAPLMDWLFDMGLAAAGWAIAFCLISLRDETLFADLGKIQVPTLILQGVRDRVCPYPLGLAQKDGIKNARLIPLETSGHGAFYEDWGRVNQQIESFMQGREL